MGVSLVRFFVDEYLDGYIGAGGSKVKLVTASASEMTSGFLRELAQAAADHDYVTAYLHAGDVNKVNVLGNVYQAAVRELDLEGMVEGCCRQVVQSLGYDPDDIPPGITFVDWVSETRGREPVSLCREIKELLERDLFRNQMLNRTFATAVLQLVGGALGAARENELSALDKTSLYGWIRAEAVALRDLRRFHMFSRIDRYNARLMLRSLVEFVRLGGKKGLFLAVEGVDVLLARKENGRALYNKGAREEFYEGIRQLIDEIDTLHHLLVVLGFRRELVDDKQAGLESYKALWLRIQNEVQGSRVNFFGDFIDLDQVPGMQEQLHSVGEVLRFERF